MVTSGFLKWSATVLEDNWGSSLPKQRLLATATLDTGLVSAHSCKSCRLRLGPDELDAGMAGLASASPAELWRRATEIDLGFANGLF